MTVSMKNYVSVVSETIELQLDASQIERVAMHLERTKLMCKELMDMDFSPECELVEIYVPAPYPVQLPNRTL